MNFNWTIKAQQIKRRDNFTCQYCGKRTELHVHHLFYVPGIRYDDYPGRFLITLCSTCHLFEHACYDLIGKNHHDKLINGMLSIDIYAKIKSKEWISERIPEF